MRWTRHVVAATHGDLRAFGWLYDQTAAVVYGSLVAQGHSDAEERILRAYSSYWAALPRMTSRDRHVTTLWLLVAAAR